MAAQTQPLPTPEAYLEVERHSQSRSEYFGGERLAMTGASRRHNLVTVNLAAELRAALRGGPCECYVSDMRLKVAATGAYAYPDVVVVCEPPRFEDDVADTLLNPRVIFEVLSPSTEAFDRGEKFAHYRLIPSLTDYLLVSQREPRLEHFQRQESGWLFAEVSGLEAEIEVASLGARPALAEVYERVDFGEPP